MIAAMAREAATVPGWVVGLFLWLVLGLIVAWAFPFDRLEGQTRPPDDEEDEEVVANEHARLR